MRGRLIRLTDLGETELSSWRALARRSVEPNPFFEPEHLLAGGRHLAKHAELMVVVAEDDGEMHGCLPLRRLRSWRGLPRPVVSTRPFLMPLCMPLLDADRGLDAMREILRFSRDDRSGAIPGLLAMEYLPAGGMVASMVDTAIDELGMARYVVERWERPVLHRHDGQLSLAPTMSKERVRQIKRRDRRLADELGQPTVVFDRADDVEAVNDFLTIEASGWKGSGDGGALARWGDTASYFRDTCAHFAQDGRLHLLALGHPGLAVAMQCAVRADGVFFLFKTGYDEQYARFAPGVQIQIAAVDEANKMPGVECVDSCADPGNEFLLSLMPDRSALSSSLLALRGRTDELVVRMLPRARPYAATWVPRLRRARATVRRGAGGTRR